MNGVEMAGGPVSVKAKGASDIPVAEPEGSLFPIQDSKDWR